MNEIKTPTPSSIAITVQCRECKKNFVISVVKNDYEDWRQGLLIQKAFPYLSAEIRELLISKICPECWDKMFKDIDPE